MKEEELQIVNREGYDELWLWFGCSRASWLTLPRAMMHEMPDEWQAKMAKLLFEWDETWDTDEFPAPTVTGRDNSGKFKKYDRRLTYYRHPDKQFIHSLMVKNKPIAK